ncbi:hypothetical protein LWI28_020197 [Acer negundo]|uniref:Uncharacterized protein n=1 Tax=Acer negundo TaxID=4023 RepID=A0AAD5J0P4_ACENE|nr:hypothetical protein LWI28_020197 [Acer negundo]
MEEETQMEVEESPSDNPIKRFGLKNCIQTNFGDDYVFQIVPKYFLFISFFPTTIFTFFLLNLLMLENGGLVFDGGIAINKCSETVLTSNWPVLWRVYGSLCNYKPNIFSGPSTPHVLHSCSSDGTINAWDTRSFQKVSSLSAGSKEIFSFSFGGSNDNLLAAGCGSQILFGIGGTRSKLHVWRSLMLMTLLRFILFPTIKTSLFSASVDGLICTLDTGGDINDDDNLESVINVGTSIGKVGFFGNTYQKLWCLTHIETLSIWDWKDGQNEANFENARQLATDNWTLDQVDYFVDCLYTGEGESLWVIGGTGAGTMGYFPVNYKGAATIGSPEAILGGGHTAVVRSILPMSSMGGRPAQSHGIFGWTGGEDGRLCCWLSDESSEINRSWISSAMVIKSPKTRKKNRHHPY